MDGRYAWVHEAGKGETVLCLHSSTSSHKQWLPLAERLAGRFRVVAVDLSGQGRMTWPSRGGDALEEEEVMTEIARRSMFMVPMAGQTIIHVLSDIQPKGFEPVEGGLEDVYFSTLSNLRRAA